MKPRNRRSSASGMTSCRRRPSSLTARRTAGCARRRGFQVAAVLVEHQEQVGNGLGDGAQPCFAEAQRLFDPIPLQQIVEQHAEGRSGQRKDQQRRQADFPHRLRAQRAWQQQGDQAEHTGAEARRTRAAARRRCRSAACAKRSGARPSAMGSSTLASPAPRRARPSTGETHPPARPLCPPPVVRRTARPCSVPRYVHRG